MTKNVLASAVSNAAEQEKVFVELSSPACICVFVFVFVYLHIVNLGIMFLGPLYHYLYKNM